ncbi:MAG: hypothetical protein GY870_16845 [archaeon]|nr:hypothetical protein [archaeon]
MTEKEKKQDINSKENARVLLLKIIFTLVFATIIDFIFLSIMTGTPRFWFPQWIDPNWDGSIDPNIAPLVHYSQSYFVGIIFLPVFFYLIYLEFLSDKKDKKIRYIYLGFASFVMLMVALWKGGIMIEQGFITDDLGWIILGLTLFIYSYVSDSIQKKREKLGTSQVFWYKAFLGIGTMVLLMGAIDALLCALNGWLWLNNLILELVMLWPIGGILTFFSLTKIKNSK